MEQDRGFFGRFEVHNTGIHGRIYVNRFNFDWGLGGDFLSVVDWVRAFGDSDEAQKIKEKNLHYFVGDFYGDSIKGKKTLDLFGLDNVSRHGDKIVHAFHIEDGIIIPREKTTRTFHADIASVLAREYEHLEANGEYNASHIPPKISGIEFVYDYATPEGRMRLYNLMEERDERSSKGLIVGGGKRNDETGVVS